MGPVVLFGAFTLRTSLEDLNARSDRDRQEAAALAATLVGRTVSTRGAQLTEISGRDDFRDALTHRDSTRLSNILAPLVSAVPDVATAGVLDSAGTVLARFPADPTAIGQSLATGDYYIGALRTIGVFMGDAVTSRFDPTLSIVTLSLAVREGSDVRGVAILTVRPTALIADLRTLDAPGREFLLIDHRSATIASTAKRPMLSLVDVPARSGSGLAPFDGVPRVFVAAAVGGADWTLYVLDDPALVYAAQATLATELGLPLVGAIVLAGALAALLASAWLLLVRGRDRLAAANVQLVELNEQVQAATRAKSDFLASMSHELRTPLNAVLGFSDVLDEQLRDTLTDRQRRYLKNIRSAGLHLLELINDVLDLSKVEAGRLVLRPEPMTLGDLLEPVVASAAHLASDRGVRFEAPVVPAATALLDPARVRQVLLNLLSNAVKFTSGGGRVSLTVAVDDRSVRFEVTDTGIGIAAEQRGRVFGVFERLHEGRSDAPGTGLGLAITKKLVELHGGSIDFASTEGAGTRFWVDLPDVLVEAAVGPRVLVVEDDPGDAELLVHLARDAGLAVEIAPSAAAALAAIARSAPTAVILDLRLPDRRGEEVLAQLKALPSTAHIPVLVVTVEDDDGRVRLLGADDHVTKPFDRDRVRAWLLRLDGGGIRARAAG
jgi:signal transduction histidine kinase/ActR/RegA family two-component response regulator